MWSYDLMMDEYWFELDQSQQLEILNKYYPIGQSCALKISDKEAAPFNWDIFEHQLIGNCYRIKIVLNVNAKDSSLIVYPRSIKMNKKFLRKLTLDNVGL